MRPMFLLLSLFLSIPSWANYVSVEGLHHWNDAPASGVSIPVAANGVTAVSGLNIPNVTVDRQGAVYLGSAGATQPGPARQWGQGGGFDPSVVGSDFLLLFGDAVDFIPGKSSVVGCQDSLYLLNFKFKNSALVNDTISARLVWISNAGKTTIQVDYYVRHGTTESVDTTTLDLPGDVSYYNVGASQQIVLGSFKRIVSKSLVGQNWVIIANGIRNVDPDVEARLQKWPFGETKSYGDTAVVFSIERQNTVFEAKTKIPIQDNQQGYIWELSPPNWFADDQIPTWKDFGTFRVVYKLNYVTGEIWRMWFAEDGKRETTALPSLLPGNGGWTSAEWPLSRFGIDPTTFDPNATTWQNLAVGPLKLMTDNPKGGSIQIDSVILTKSQPSSYQISEVVTPTVPRHKLTVSVVGDSINGRKVQATLGDSTATLFTASGKVQFDLPEGIWTVVVTPPLDGAVDPVQQQANLTQDLSLTFTSATNRPRIIGPSQFSVNEGDTLTWPLDSMLVTHDQNIPVWRAAWSLAWVGDSKLPIQIDGASRRLVVGQLGSLANGSGRYVLRATLPNGIFAEEPLTVVVRSVNQAPVIHPIHWTVPVNGVLSVRLDSVFNGMGVWGHDLDDAPGTLVWSAQRTSRSPSGMRLAMDGKRLTVAPAENIADSLVFMLKVQDPSGAQDSQLVVVEVVPGRMLLFGVSASQVSTGDVEVEFESRFTSTSVDLQRAEVKLERSSAWGTIPASLEVLEPASFVRGTWIDGRYRVTIRRDARWTSGKTSGRFDSLFQNLSSLKIRLPLAADGKQDSLDVTLASLRFVGPTGSIQGTWKHLVADTLHRAPILALDWNWDRSVHDQFVIVRDANGIILWSDSLSASKREIEIPGILDSTAVKVVVSGLDGLGNRGELHFSGSSPSGLYTVKLNFTGTQLREVTGKICLLDSLMVCQPLEAKASGDYSFVHLRQGKRAFVVLDPKWMGVGDTLVTAVSHQDLNPTWNLVPRHFLGADAVVISPERGTGDWLFQVHPLSPFSDESPSRVVLQWATTSKSGTLDLAVTSSTTSTDDDGTPLWSFRLTRKELLSALGSSEQFWGVRIPSLRIYTNLQVAGQPVAFRSEETAYPSATAAWFEQQLGQLPHLSVSHLAIGWDGNTKFNLGNLSNRHEARQLLTLCLMGPDGPEHCEDTLLGPSRARFAAEVALAAPVQGLPFLLQSRGTDGMHAQVPAGAKEAAAEWPFYWPKDTVLHLHIDRVKSSNLPKTFQVSMDSGTTWNSKTILLSGWSDFGSVAVKKGWNRVAVRIPSEVVLRGFELRNDGSTPATTTTKDTLVPPQFLRYSSKLLPDRQYSLQVHQYDEMGNVSDSTERIFLTRPQGALSDLSIIQQEATGDLLLQSNATRIQGGEDFTVQLAPGLPKAVAKRVIRADSLFELKILRKDLPASFLAYESLRKARTLDSIVLSSTTSVTETYPVIWRGLTVGFESQTIDVAENQVVSWPGATPWLNSLDYRAPAWFNADSVGGTHDSVAYLIHGLNNDSAAGVRMPGVLHAKWTPGSSCAASSSLDIPYGNVFSPNANQVFAFQPRLGGAIASAEGAWIGNVEEKQRHQWLDQAQGGGFFPPANYQATGSEGPWVDFVVRPTILGTRQWNMWILPGSSNTESNKTYRWGVEKMASLAAPTTGIVMQTATALYTASAPEGWLMAPQSVTMDTGLYRLRLQMVQDGFTVRGVVLQPVGLPAPVLAAADLPTTGAWGYDSLRLEAGALAAGTSHTFEFQAQDRKGNLGSLQTVTMTTPVSSVRISGLQIQIAGADSSGWIKGDRLLAHVLAVPGGVTPSTIVATLHVLGSAAAPVALVVTSDPQGGWDVTSPVLGAWPASMADLTAGRGYQLEVRGVEQGTKGPSTVSLFGVRDIAHAQALTGLVPEATLDGLTFKVLEAWPEDGLIYANLELPRLTKTSSDSLETRIVLRGAVVTLAGTPQAIASVAGGTVSALRCTGKAADRVCREAGTADWTLGPWPATLSMANAQVVRETVASGYKANRYLLSLPSSEFLDDKQRLVRTGSLLLHDAGLVESTLVTQDRVWFQNVVGNGKAKAFSLEACRMSITAGDGSSLDMSLKGCRDDAGPFLSFGIHLDTESPFTLMGEAFDSLLTPYHLGWNSSTGYVPQTDTVVVTSSSLKDFSGASVWGYDVHKYSFGPSGVHLLDFDLILPQGKVFPGVSDAAWRVKHFTGLSVVSDLSNRDGLPTMSGSAQSLDNRNLPFNTTQILTGIKSWNYHDVMGYGSVIEPVATSAGLVIQTPQPTGALKFQAIGGTALSNPELVQIPVSKMVFGPGLFAEIASVNSFEAKASGIKVAGTLSIAAAEESMEITASNLTGTAGGISFPTGSAPSIGSTTDWASQGDQIPLSDLVLQFDEKLALLDVTGGGMIPETSALFVGRLPLIGFQSQSKFQLVPGRGDILIRLGTPNAWFSDLNYSKNSEATNWVQSAVFNSSALPVAVGAELPVPSDMRELKFPGFPGLGSLSLNRVTLNASIVDKKLDLALETQSTLELGSAFAFVGLDGWRLALNHLVLGLDVNGTTSASSLSVRSLEVAPLGIPASMELTADQLAKWYSGDAASTTSGPALVRLYTSGQPVLGTWDGNTKIFKVSLTNWAVELTKDFPIPVMRNLNFYLDNLDVSWQTGADSKGSVKIANVAAHGEYSLDSLEITSGLVLLPAVSTEANSTPKVKVGLGAEANKPFLSLSAGRVRMGQDTFNLGCSGVNAAIKIRLDGKLTGDFCYELDKDISIYPLGADRNSRKVWIQKKGQVHVSLDGATVTLSLKQIKVQTVKVEALNTNDDGLLFDGSLTASFGPKGIEVMEASLKLDPEGTKMAPFNLDPFKVTIDQLGLSVAEHVLTISATPKLAWTSGGTCTADAQSSVKMSADIRTGSKFDFTFDLGANLTCDLAGFKATANGIHLPAVANSNDFASIKVDQLLVDFSAAKSILDPGETSTTAPPHDNSWKNLTMGIEVKDLGYYANAGDSKGFHMGAITPIGFKLNNLKVNIANTGVVAWADLDASALFRISKPGVAFDNIRIQLPNELGSQTFATNFAVRVDGVSPFVHARGNLKELPIPIPSIKLTETIKFDGAKLRLKFVEAPTEGEKDYWILEGNAGLQIPGLASGIDVEMALKKPSPEDCRTGICKAVLTLNMKPGRIPLGTTGLYMTSMMGGFYDGYYVPKCAQACDITTLPKGMKFELAIYVEGQDSNSLRGSTGFWMQLNKLNLGVNGQLIMLSGSADATACAAIFNNGSAFHGAFTIAVHAALEAKGGFYIDIWSENGNNNMAAEASASIGVKRATFIRSRWFKFPRSTWWMGPLITRLGKFQSGGNGFTTGVRALGRTWGIGYVGGGLRLGNMGNYRLAKPTQSLLAGESKDYALMPLGLDLKGGEVVSVAVTTAKGKDWQGQKLQFVGAEQINDPFKGTSVPSMLEFKDLGGSDQAETDEEDSTNTHTLTWLNNNQTGALYVAIPKTIGTQASVESEVVDNTALLSGYDDLQLFVGLIPPTPQLTAAKCATGDTSEICFSGTVAGFRKDPVKIYRTMASNDFPIAKSGFSESNRLVYAGKHRLVLSAVPHIPPNGNMKSDSSAAVEIALDQFEGQPSNTWSLADNSCAQYDADKKLLTLNNCRWHNQSWRSGSYHFEAGIDEVNLKSSEANGLQATLLTEADTSNVVSLGRTVVASATEPSVAVARLAWKHPANFKKVRGLAVYGSALDSLTGPGGDERNTLRCSWIPTPHPDLAGYVVRWPIGQNLHKDFLTGPEGEWHINLPENTNLDAKAWDSTLQAGQVLRGPETPEWYFKVPDSLQVIPAIFRESYHDTLDSQTQLVTTDTTTEVVPLDSLAVTWKSGALKIGQPDGGTANAFTLKAPPPAAQTTWDVSLMDHLTIPVTLNVPTLDTGSTAVRPASDYLEASLAWVDSLGALVNDTGHIKPPVGIGQARMRVNANQMIIPIGVSPVVDSVPCASLITHDSSVVETLLNRGACREGQYLLRRSMFGTSYLKMSVFNQARRGPNLEQSVVVPVRVVPPTPVIDNIQSNYLSSGRNQVLKLNLSRYWVEGDSVPLLRIRNQDGLVIDSVLLTPDAMSFASEDTLLRKQQLDTLNHLHRARAEIRLKWRGNKISPLGDSLKLEVINRTAMGRYTSPTVSMELLNDADLAKLECSERFIDEAITPKAAWGMDFVGFYPKSRAPGSRVRALFSEIHNPQELLWIASVEQQGVKLPITDLSVSEDGVEFNLPIDLIAGKPATISLSINTTDENIRRECNRSGAAWTSTSTLSQPAYNPTTPSLSRIKFLVQDSLVQVTGLQSDESYVWWRGQPPNGFAARLFAGVSGGFVVPQTDWVHVRVTNTSGLLVRDTALLVHHSIFLNALDGERILQPIDSVRVGHRVSVTSRPLGTQGKTGESSLRLECRWNLDGWSECPSAGFDAGLSHSGLLVARPVWTVQSASGAQTIVGAQSSWRIQTRSLESEGITSVRLESPASRLGQIIDHSLASTVVLIRRQGADLPLWPATAPVVRDADGQILPQEVERWNPAAREYLAWVRVPKISPRDGLVLQLWLGDTSKVVAAWNAGDTAVHQGPLGSLMGAAITTGARQSYSWPALNGQGFTASLWTNWTPTTDTLWCRGGICLGADANGAVWIAHNGQKLISASGVLDTTESFLVSSSWEGISGKTRLLVNGRVVAIGSLQPGADASLPRATGWIGGGRVDEFRWESHVVPDEEFRLRWENERSRSQFWSAPSAWPGTRPVVQRLRGGVMDTVAAYAGERLFADRERFLDTVAPLLQGALLIQGSGSSALDSASGGEQIALERAARLCALTDSGWKPNDAQWQMLPILSQAGDAQLVPWCREVSAGIQTLGTARTLGEGNRLGLSWMLLPSLAPVQRDSLAAAGQVIGGWILPDPLDAFLKNAKVRTGSPSAAGGLAVSVQGPGQVWGAFRIPSSFADSMGRLGWSGPMGTIVVRQSGSDSTVTLGLFLKTSSVTSDSLVYAPSQGPVLVFVRPVRGTSSQADSLSLDDALPFSSGVRGQGLRATDSGASVVGPDGKTLWIVPPPQTDMVDVAASCASRGFVDGVHLGAGVRYLLVPLRLNVAGLSGWTRDGLLEVSGTPWVRLRRSKGAGAETLDLSALWSDPNACAEYITWFEEAAVAPPTWRLGELSVRGLGGSRQAWGGEHRLKDLDLRPVAGLSLTSPQYQMSLASMSGWATGLQKMVLSLGTPRTELVTDSTSGSSEVFHVVREGWLQDLWAQDLNADSVRVDLRTLEASGVVRLTLRDRSQVPLQTSLKAVLYRDLNGDKQYTAGVDQELGAQVLSLDGSRIRQVDFAVNGQRLFPEEVFLAFVDGGATLPELRVGDHSVQSPGRCASWKAFDWMPNSTTLALPKVSGDVLVQGQAMRSAHLRSTDGVPGITENDSLDWLWISPGSGKLCMAQAGRDTSWCREVGGASLSEVVVRQILGNGQAQIMAGDQVLDVSGSVLWSDSVPLSGADFDDDGLVDSLVTRTLSTGASCREVFSHGTSLWADPACGRGYATRLAQIAPDPAQCADASLSYPRALVGHTGIKIRLANAGTRALPSGTRVVLINPAGVQTTQAVSDRALDAGEWEDLILETGSPLTAGTWSAGIASNAAGMSGIVEISTLNNSIQWMEQTP